MQCTDSPERESSAGFTALQTELSSTQLLRKYLKVNSIDTEISRECMGAVIPPVRVRISELKARKRLLNK